MFSYCDENIDGIEFLFVSEKDIELNATKFDLENRYSNSDKYKGSRSHHCFIPLNDYELHMKRVSTDSILTKITSTSKPDGKTISDFTAGIYVACTYDGDWYIGNVMEVSHENNDVLCKFMRRNNNSYKWPRYDDKCWVPINHIICKVESLVVQNQRARCYTVSNSEFDFISKNFSNFL